MFTKSILSTLSIAMLASSICFGMELPQQPVVPARPKSIYEQHFAKKRESMIGALKYPKYADENIPAYKQRKLERAVANYEAQQSFAEKTLFLGALGTAIVGIGTYVTWNQLDSEQKFIWGITNAVLLGLLGDKLRETISAKKPTTRTIKAKVKERLNKPYPQQREPEEFDFE